MFKRTFICLRLPNQGTQTLQSGAQRNFTPLMLHNVGYSGSGFGNPLGGAQAAGPCSF